MLARLNIYDIYTSAGHPSETGDAERLHQTIKRMLITHHNDYPHN
jgi:hypothetical protein